MCLWPTRCPLNVSGVSQYDKANSLPSDVVDEDIAGSFGDFDGLVAICVVGGVEEVVREIVGSRVAFGDLYLLLRDKWRSYSIGGRGWRY